MTSFNLYPENSWIFEENILIQRYLTHLVLSNRLKSTLFKKKTLLVIKNSKAFKIIKVIISTSHYLSYNFDNKLLLILLSLTVFEKQRDEFFTF